MLTVVFFSCSPTRYPSLGDGSSKSPTSFASPPITPSSPRSRSRSLTSSRSILPLLQPDPNLVPLQSINPSPSRRSTEPPSRPNRKRLNPLRPSRFSPDRGVLLLRGQGRRDCTRRGRWARSEISRSLSTNPFTTPSRRERRRPTTFVVLGSRPPRPSSPRKKTEVSSLIERVWRLSKRRSTLPPPTTTIRTRTRIST
jgi:hypothetical protein